LRGAETNGQAKGIDMRIVGWICMVLCIIGFVPSVLAVETGMYRLLSVSGSEKLILVSQIPGKHKYLLDAASAKITVNGKPAEFKELDIFSIIQVKFELRKSVRNGVELDGSAKEIKVNPIEKPNSGK
jgi:hypothetical protein